MTTTEEYRDQCLQRYRAQREQLRQLMQQWRDGGVQRWQIEQYLACCGHNERTLRNLANQWRKPRRR